MGKDNFTDEELEGLTEEEVEALAEDDESGESDNKGADDADDASDDDSEKAAADKDDDKADEADDVDEAAKTDTDVKADADKADADKNDADKETDQDKDTDTKGTIAEQPDYVPTMQFKDIPKDLNEQLASLGEEANVLGQKLTDGEITLPEYHANLLDITNRRDDLNVARAKSEVAQGFNENKAATRWEVEQDLFFMQEGKEEYLTNGALYAALNAEVSVISQDEKFANASGLAVLAEADKRVQQLFNKQPETTTDTDNDKGDKEKQDTKDKKEEDNVIDLAKKKTGKKAAQEEKPKTLSHIPAADDADVGQDKYASLDGLEGMELEEALEKLPEEEAEKYLSV